MKRQATELIAGRKPKRNCLKREPGKGKNAGNG